jgi:hypothetical protein
MKKYLLLLILMVFFSYGNAYSFEISGLQPVAPYGVFSTFSTASFPKGQAAFSADGEILIEPNSYKLFFKTAYGLTDKIELELGIPYVFGPDSPDGFEDVAVGFKHRFFDEGKYGPSFAYIITASLPTGRDEYSTDGRLGVGLLMSKRVGPLNGHMNLFYIKPGKGSLDSEIAFLTGLDLAIANNFNILSELYCKTSYNTGRVDLLEGRLGYRIKTMDNMYTTFGVGYDFKNRTPEARIMFSITFLTPFKKEKIKNIYEEE